MGQRQSREDKRQRRCQMLIEEQQKVALKTSDVSLYRATKNNNTFDVTVMIKKKEKPCVEKERRKRRRRRRSGRS